MKTTDSLILFMALALCVGNNAGASEILLRVADENKKPLVGADTLISFLHPQQKDKGHHGKANKEGHFKASGKNVVGVFVRVTKDGYYEWVREKGFGQQDHDITVVMRKIENPIPLFVRKVNLKFPAYDEWLGFDFETGDWVAPQGKGKSKDILFKFHREYMGSDYSERELAKIIPRVKEIKKKRGEKWDPEEFRLKTAKWKSEFRIRFSSDLEGIVEEKEGYLTYSEMKMPHLAPKEGYQSEEIVIEKKSYKSNEEETEEMRHFLKFGKDKPSGYYIRTRVTEVDGKAINANYAKLPRMIEVGPAGSLSFVYYFNPTANDRNLEFHPKSNLATEQNRDYRP